MKFINKHIISIIIISLLIVSCFLLFKKNKEFKEELNTVNEELQYTLQRKSALIIKFKNDFNEYYESYQNLHSNFQYFSRPQYQKNATNIERYLASRIIYQYMMRQSNQLKGFGYLLYFPEYSLNQSLLDQFNQIDVIETDLIVLIMNDTETLIDKKDYIWGQDTLFSIKFRELKNESEKFYATLDSLSQ